MKTAKTMLVLLAMSAAGILFTGCTTTEDARESPPPNTRAPSTMPTDPTLPPGHDPSQPDPFPDRSVP